MIQAVFFDLYETLITEWENGQKKANYSIGGSVKGLGLNETLYKQEWRARREKRMDGTYPDHKSVLKDIFNSLGEPFNEDTLERLDQRRIKAKLIPFQDIEPDIIQMLQSLKRKNIKLGLISNCTAEEVEGFWECPLANYFDDVIFSYEVKQAKPNVGIYEKACRRLQVVADDTLFIGDGGSNELVGALEFGMKAYHATWFLPDFISEEISGFPKLGKPSEVIGLVEG